MDSSRIQEGSGEVRGLGISSGASTVFQRLTLRIAGRVQGVGFRWFVHRQAQPLGVTGYVRNCADGSVEVVAEGDGAALDRLEGLCRQGPGTARVTKVERDVESAPQRSFDSFDIG